MLCQRCGEPVDEGEEREFHGRVLCEDCYMDALSPARACDPWAVYTAKSLVREEGKGAVLNPTQTRIIEILRTTGGLEPGDLAERLRIKPSDLERELAALRHMEKIRGEIREGKRFVIPW